jgi:hypothetical protein
MKKYKIKAQALTGLANNLLGKEILEEDLLSNPDKIEQYAKVLDESLTKIYRNWEHISGEADVEEKVDRILYYYRLLKYVCVDEERLTELMGLWQPRTIEKLKEMGQWETFNEWDDQREELERLRMNTEWNKYEGVDGDEDAFYDLITRLKKCEDEKCGKWFVKTAKNKRFCNRLCAARSKQRLKRKEDPEAFKKYHRDDYQKRKKKKGGA